MEPLLDPESDEASCLQWALREGILREDAELEVLVERRRGGAVVHTMERCARIDPKVRSEKQRLPLRAALDDPGPALGSKRGRACTACAGTIGTGQHRAQRSIEALKRQGEELEALGRSAVAALTRLQAEQGSPLEGGEWELLTVLDAKLQGGKVQTGTEAFGIDAETFEEDTAAWAQKSTRPYQVLRDLLQEAAAERVPENVLGVLGAQGCSLEGARTYLAPEWRGVQGCQHPEHAYVRGALERLWGVEIQAAAAGRGPGGHAKTLRLLVVPETIAPYVARWTGTVQVGPYQETRHEELAEVAAQLAADSQLGGLTKPSEIVVAAGIVLGLNGFEVRRHTDDEDTSPEPEWLSELLSS